MQHAHVAPDFDLQSHSLESDGSLSPADVVAAAAASGIRLMALTDHDTVDGVSEALDAAREHGLRCSPAAELSSVSGEFEDLHVCGYELRHDDPGLRTTLADFRADRGRRIWAMADRLGELGFAPDRRAIVAPDDHPPDAGGGSESSLTIVGMILRDHVAVVAGATRGGGRAVALELGAAGATVYVTGRSAGGRRPPT